MHSLRKTGCALALLVLPLGGYAAKPAADLPGATLPELLIWAEQHNPELTAMQHDVEAAEARVQPAGALPDPMFSVEWRDIPNDSDFTLAPSRVGSMKYLSLIHIFIWWERPSARAPRSRSWPMSSRRTLFRSL